MKYACNMVGRRKFPHHHLPVSFASSHTHGQGGPIMGDSGTTKSVTSPKLLDPTSTIQVMESELKRPGVRQWIGATTHLNVDKLNATRDWKVQWDDQGSKLEGGLLEDSTANHAFIFLSRGGPRFLKKTKIIDVDF